MKNFSLFQGVIIGICVVAGIAGLLLFSTFRGGSKEVQREIVIWGFLPEKEFALFANDLWLDAEAGNPKINYMTYIEKNQETFDSELVEALAVGNGPDVLFVDHDTIFRNWNKLANISYTAYPEKDFKQTYIEGADITRVLGGIRSFPVTVDPLVMYWNRDLFTNEGIATPPKTWTEFLSIVPDLSVTDELGTVYRSAVALGENRNIKESKDILTTLIMQAGNPLVVQSQERLSDGTIRTYLDSVVDRKESNQVLQPAQNALQFYAQYSDPSRDLYSWNKSLDQDVDLFLQGDVAMYFGKASEYEVLKKRNPNLNFDVAPIPQISGETKLVVGDFMALAVVNNGKDLRSSYDAVLELLAPRAHMHLAKRLGLPPTRRDFLASPPPEAAAATFYEVALYTKAFIDISPNQSSVLFDEMVEGYVTGAKSLGEAVSDFSTKLRIISKDAQETR